MIAGFAIASSNYSLHEVQDCKVECPDDYSGCLRNTYETRFTSSGVMQYKWKCNVNYNHVFWMKAR